MEKHEQFDFFPEEAKAAGEEKARRKHLRGTKGVNPQEIRRRQTKEKRGKLVDNELAAMKRKIFSPSSNPSLNKDKL